MKDKPKPDQLVKYIENSALYIVIGECLAKQEDGEWVPSIAYRPLRQGAVPFYVRDIPYFMAKFTET